MVVVSDCLSVSALFLTLSTIAFFPGWRIDAGACEGVNLVNWERGQDRYWGEISVTVCLVRSHCPSLCIAIARLNNNPDQRLLTLETQ